ncbi:MAG: FAD-binding protein, partial [Longimicrobiales bacterium]|nr:FAD-binding protein [Longimicrobiales bacterium]
ALLEACAELNVRILEDHLAVDLRPVVDPTTGELRCGGVYALDHHLDRRVLFRAPVTMLASGGCGTVYRHTTNPSIATGDGVAMAYRAGARVGNMEFIQFHPTALYPTEDPAFLISEAVRGEGAILRRKDGSSFMEAYDPRGSLASRDIVARAIHQEMKTTGDDHVILDISPIPRDQMELRFPGAVAGCRERGVDLFEDGIPVVPAAHYSCGGVETDLEGRTSLPGLYAAGEVTFTGMHGANRLASNSLLEAVVLSHRAAEAVLREMEDGGAGWKEEAVEVELPLAEFPGPDRSRGPGGTEAEDGAAGPGGREGKVSSSPDGASPPRDATAIRRRLRDLMWEKVGIVRSDRELGEAAVELESLLRDGEARWRRGPWSVEAAELRNLAVTAWLIVECARSRKESRGLHHNVDHPRRDDASFKHDTLVRRPLPGSPVEVTEGGGDEPATGG